MHICIFFLRERERERDVSFQFQCPFEKGLRCSCCIFWSKVVAVIHCWPFWQALMVPVYGIASGLEACHGTARHSTAHDSSEEHGTGMAMYITILMEEHKG